MTPVTCVAHPLVGRALGELRDIETSTEVFRSRLAFVGAALTLDATAGLATSTRRVTTPLADTEVVTVDPPVLVSVLRAGNGMLDGALSVVPDAAVGVVGLARDEVTLEAGEYLVNLPDVANRPVLVLDPMLATGHTACAALDRVAEHNPDTVTLICLVAAPEGISEVHRRHPDVRIVTAAIDDHLNEVGYIVPGLGDAGDRLYGT